MTDRIKAMTPTAARLACAVGEMDVRESHAILKRLTRDQLLTVAVILAASVDLDRPLGEVVASRMDTPTRRDVHRIAVVVAAHQEVSVESIFSTKRDREITQARQIVCWLAEAEGHRPSHIGSAIGRDHSTVLHGIEKVTKTPSLLAIARQIQTDMKREAA